MQVTADSRPRVSLLARARPWVAVIIAAIIFALIPLIGLQLIFVLPPIGLALAAGAPPDYVPDAKPVDRRPRNVILGILVLICLAITVLQPQLTLWIVALFGLDGAGLAVALIPIAALALRGSDRGYLVCRSRTSYLPIAAFIVGLPIPLVLSRLLAARPLKQVRTASNLLVLSGSLFIAAQLLMIYRPAANPVPIASPLAEEWLVGQGAHAELINYHYVTSTQRDALDILQARNGRTHQPGSTELTSYYIYGKPVLAPADGTVAFVLDGRPDQQIGSTDGRFQSGNNIVLDIGGGHFVMMAHLSPGSIQVKVGDQVKAGQQIAKVGNSGNTTEPHLHIQAQSVGTGVGDIATIDAPALIRTLHTTCLVFRDVVLIRRGVESRPADADPRRGDLVRPAS